MKKYYTTEEVEKGISDENGVEIIPPINPTTLRSLRQARKLQYTKLGNQCMYTVKWLQEYLDRNVVETVA